MGLHAHAASQETPGNAATSTLTRLVVFHPPPRRPWGPIIRLPPFSFPVILPRLRRLIDPHYHLSVPTCLPSLPSLLSQRLPDPRDPDLQNLFTVGGWTNGAAKKAETSTDDGDIWWQGRLRGIALTRDDQKRLAPVEVETKRGAIPLDYVQCSRETLRGDPSGCHRRGTRHSKQERVPRP